MTEIIAIDNGWGDPAVGENFARCMHQRAMSAHDESVIYAGRNRLVRLPSERGDVIVKCFKTRGLQKIAYRVRSGKARRSFEHAQRLLDMGIATPAPVALFEKTQAGWPTLSAYACLEWNGAREARTLVKDADAINSEDVQLASMLGLFVARVHERGVVHKDLTPGNILMRKVSGHWEAGLVDVNRMRFQQSLPAAQALDNLVGLCLDGQVGEAFLRSYCETLGKDFAALWPMYASKREAYRSWREWKRRTRPLRRRLLLQKPK